MRHCRDLFKALRREKEETGRRRRQKISGSSSCGIERGQFSSVAGARLFSLGKIQMRISFGDLESKGISHLFRRIFG